MSGTLFSESVLAEENLTGSSSLDSLLGSGKAEPPSVDRYSLPASSSRIDSIRGQLRPVNHTVLSAGIDGKLATFSVKAGVTLKKGDLIAEFVCYEEEAAYAIAIARQEVAATNVEVNRKLDSYQNISEVDLGISVAELAIARAEAQKSSAIMKECRILSPFDATVTDKYVEAHQYVQKGEPLLEIVDTRNLEIEMVLPSLDLQLYQRGFQFSLIIDETGETVLAEIDRVVNVIDPVSQTIRIIGKLISHSGAERDSQQNRLMPGMSGVVVFSE